ncbi:MAG: glutamine amidotransferase [Deltaproteobacteria bacterium]|jgi:GMP synthase (glutamine-hydrolysing)|nr:glutamine amidotransferase [Deltaproteobacteria bacterium]
MTILILETGAVPKRYNSPSFSQLFIREGNIDINKCDVINVTKYYYLGNPAKYSGYIVTGSISMVTKRPIWSTVLRLFLTRLIDANSPLLAVCYGHQLLAYALGGRVDYHPLGKEQGTHTIRLRPEAKSHPLLSGLPESFPANLSHSQAVLELPKGARLLGGSDHDPHQIVAYGDSALSVQFHPEFNKTVMLAFARTNMPDYPKNRRKPTIPVNLGLPIEETPVASSILQRFVANLGASSTSKGDLSPKGLYN